MVTKITLSTVWVTAKIAGALGLTQFVDNGKLMALLYRSVPYSPLVATHTGIVARLKASKIDCMSCVVGLDPSVKQVMNSGLLQPRSGVYNDKGPWFVMRTASEAAKMTCFTPHSMNMEFCSGRTGRMVSSPLKSLGRFDSGSPPEMNNKIKVGALAL